MNLLNPFSSYDSVPTWTFILLASLLATLVSFAFYLLALFRARVRRIQLWISVFVLGMLVLWGGSVAFSAYQVYDSYNTFAGVQSFGRGFSFQLLGGVSLIQFFNAPYVEILYSLLFLALAAISLLLRHTLRLRLALALLQAQDNPQQKAALEKDKDEEPFSEEYDEPDGYMVEVVSLDSARKLPDTESSHFLGNARHASRLFVR